MRKSKLAVLALAVVMALGYAVPAGATTPAEIPRAGNMQYFKDPSFLGVRAYMLQHSITATEIVANDAGILYGICRQGSTLGDYTAALDYYSAEGYVAAGVNISKGFGPLIDGSVSEYLMSPYVYVEEETATSVYAQAENVRGCWWPKWPIRFENGLIGLNNSVNGYSLFFYRLDDGGNPH